MLPFWTRTDDCRFSFCRHPLRAKEGEGTAGPAADRSKRSVRHIDRQTCITLQTRQTTIPQPCKKHTAAQSAQSSKRHRRRRPDGRGSEALQNAVGTKEKNRANSKAKEQWRDQKHIRKRGRCDFSAAVRLAKQALKHNSDLIYTGSSSSKSLLSFPKTGRQGDKWVQATFTLANRPSPSEGKSLYAQKKKGPKVCTSPKIEVGSAGEGYRTSIENEKKRDLHASHCFRLNRSMTNSRLARKSDEK